MMQKIILKVTTSDQQPLSNSWGYSLYGVLAHSTDSAYMESLHQTNSTPIHQFLEILPNRTEALWHIHPLNDDAIHYFGKAIEGREYFSVQRYHTDLQILEKNIENALSETDFCQKYLIEQPCERRQTLQFLTPIGFKSQDTYQIFPTEELMIKSLWNHWQQHATEVLLEGEDVRTQLIENVQIVDYRLRSTRFPLKGVKIPSFTGKLVLKIHGPEALVRLVNLLTHFGEYSGLGMKTALGMGGYRLENSGICPSVRT